jgi:hypothetical protein
MKRGEFSDREICLIRSVEKEFELFKYKTLSASRKEIFQQCNVIRFFCGIYEYFEYAEDIRQEHINACLKCGDSVIAALYGIYQGREYLRYERREDIVELLNALAADQEKCGMPQTAE